MFPSSSLYGKYIFILSIFQLIIWQKTNSGIVKMKQNKKPKIIRGCSLMWKFSGKESQNSNILCSKNKKRLKTGKILNNSQYFNNSIIETLITFRIVFKSFEFERSTSQRQREIQS